MKKIIAFFVVLFFIPFTLFSQSFGFKFGPGFGWYNPTNINIEITNSHIATFDFSSFYQITNRKNVNIETSIEWDRRSCDLNYEGRSPGGTWKYSNSQTQNLILLSLYPVINIGEKRYFSLAIGPKYGFDAMNAKSGEIFLFTALSYEISIQERNKIKFDLYIQKSLYSNFVPYFTTTEVGLSVGLRHWF